LIGKRDALADMQIFQIQLLPVLVRLLHFTYRGAATSFSRYRFRCD
jgi:hypothetical protein